MGLIEKERKRKRESVSGMSNWAMDQIPKMVNAE